MRLPIDKPLRLIIATCLLLLALPAAAARLELQAGRSYMSSRGTATVFVESVFDEHRIGNTRFSWSPDVSLGWINGRDIGVYRHNRYGTTEDAWVLAGGVRAHYGDAGDWYHHVFLSFQPAYNSARTQALSSAYEFVSTLGWQGQHFSVEVRHISNGALHHPNRGETMALVGVAFQL
ncbi:MAG: acyloxyacyl hydrolase [Xanthomonadaceae bacterium]|nr:acyloxyacyl hydrolase [Xanthomonadaceae bacterium]